MAERTLLGFHNPVLLTAFGTQKGRKTVSFLCPSGFRHFQISSLECMAGTTGLEPATSAVTGSNLLKLSVTDGFFWRFEVPLVTVIGPLLDLRPLSCKPLPLAAAETRANL